MHNYRNKKENAHKGHSLLLLVDGYDVFFRRVHLKNQGDLGLHLYDHDYHHHDYDRGYHHDCDHGFRHDYVHHGYGHDYVHHAAASITTTITVTITVSASVTAAFLEPPPLETTGGSDVKAIRLYPAL